MKKVMVELDLHGTTPMVWVVEERRRDEPRWRIAALFSTKELAKQYVEDLRESEARREEGVEILYRASRCLGICDGLVRAV